MDIDPYNDPLAFYGIHKEDIINLGEEEENLSGFVSEKLGIRKAQVVWAVRKEMARTLEDVLARRTRALFLDARESLRMAPKVAAIMAKELKQNKSWEEKQIAEFYAVAKNYYFE